jgi:hypothetical protein
MLAGRPFGERDLALALDMLSNLRTGELSRHCAPVPRFQMAGIDCLPRWRASAVERATKGAGPDISRGGQSGALAGPSPAQSPAQKSVAVLPVQDQTTTSERSSTRSTATRPGFRESGHGQRYEAVGKRRGLRRLGDG